MSAATVEEVARLYQAARGVTPERALHRAYALVGGWTSTLVREIAASEARCREYERRGDPTLPAEQALLEAIKRIP